MALDLNIEALVPSGTEPYAPSAEVELLLRAVESPRGIAVSYPSTEAAIMMRFRLYRARRAEQERGNTSFDTLILTIKDTRLFLKPAPSASDIIEL